MKSVNTRRGQTRAQCSVGQALPDNVCVQTSPSRKRNSLISPLTCPAGILSPTGEGHSVRAGSSPLRGKVSGARMRGYQLGFTRPSSSRSVLMRDIGASYGIMLGRAGFTLIEILMVVLIIGILGAIMLPQYQRAVLKSRFAALMPIAKSMVDSNEAYYLEHGEYAGNAEDLPVQGRQNYPDGTTLEFGTTSEYSYVLATRGEDFPNHYIVYQKHSEKFPDNIHCEADENNDMAKEVCLSLGGQKIEGSLKDGFITYAISGMRTLSDTFPTSISKLKSQICEGFSPENCIVDEKTIRLPRKSAREI